LVASFIPDTLIGIEFLWGGQVQLETTEIRRTKEQKLEYKKVLYTTKDKKISKIEL
jgi:stage V sporulation protein R